MTSRTHDRATWGLFALTIFLSAFLIFQVQPLISKYILPWFGGTPAVWTTCMLFFQVLLFGGYAYAHASIRSLSPRTQALLHGALLLAAATLLPITPDASWKPTGDELPLWRILGLLTMTVGLPYFLLSATGPLLQGWFNRTQPGVSPYRLYALSNIGSVLGLVTYPFVFEPLFAAEWQAGLWSAGFIAFAVCCGACALRMGWSASNETAHQGAEGDNAAPSPSWSIRGAWFGLAACASVMLLATTNQVCMDVAVIPFLWVLPLTLYLTSFIFCFDGPAWYPRRLYAAGLTVAIVCLYVLLMNGGNVPLLTQAIVHFVALFFCCMVCHGELVRLRPSPRHLTSFYLTMSAGGAAGGLMVGLIAPLVFTRYLELHLVLLASCVIAMTVLMRDEEWLRTRGQPRWIFGCLLLGLFGSVRAIATCAAETEVGELAVSRNFYGVLKVAQADLDEPHMAMNRLVHGRIVHGMQFLAEERRQIPTSYYGRTTGIGLLLDHGPWQGPRRVGMVGLGVGTLAAYGNPGDTFRFYEINPDVIRLAEEHFSYLQDSKAKVEMVLGDARLSLERESPQQFDLLVLDAFSSDAIPTHLLTSEAFEIYQRHLKPNGLMAIHISNRHFDLQPVVQGAAERFDMHAVKIRSQTIVDQAQARAEWMLLSRDPAVLDIPELREAITATQQSTRTPLLWTDTRNNVVSVLKTSR